MLPELLLLPDVCERPAKKRRCAPKPAATSPREVPVLHSESATSLSSASSVHSRASATSSQCSFAPVKRSSNLGSNGRVRIAVGGHAASDCV